jgi:hypothetical protein
VGDVAVSRHVLQAIGAAGRGHVTLDFASQSLPSLKMTATSESLSPQGSSSRSSSVRSRSTQGAMACMPQSINSVARTKTVCGQLLNVVLHDEPHINS